MTKAQLIAELERAQQEIGKSRKRLHDLLEGSQQGVIIHRGFEPLLVNQALVDMFGYRSVEEMLGMDDILALAPVGERSKWVGFNRARMRGEDAPAEYEYEGVRKDGSRLWVNNLVRLVEWDGEPAIQSTLIDITERKHREAELREREEQVRLLLTSTAEAIYGIDLEGNCTFYNPACVQMLGYDGAEDLLGEHMHDLIHHTRPDDTPYPAEQCLIYQAFRKGEGSHVENEVLWRKDGTSFAAEYWSYPIRRDGAVVGAVVTFLDITERRNIERQLRQAQRLEAVGQLTGGIAHDFNNLLAVIMGNADLLAERLGDDNEATRAVIRAARRGAELTQRLLAFSRQQPLRSQAIDLNDHVSGMLDMLHRTLGETIEIKTLAARGLWKAEADLGQLENALLNLALNARDAMPGGGMLVIETGNASLDDTYRSSHPDVAPGDYVLLTVSDTGTGMAPDVLDHAFDPFFTTKDRNQGSGLGLSMVYGFAKQSRGHLAIYSEAGHGTAVKLYLPRTGLAFEQVGRETAEEEPRGRGETILVVEDAADVRQLTVALLADLGYLALAAADGQAALAIVAARSRIDLLLSDMVLPGALSGPDLAAEIKGRHPAIKVLFMTGYARHSAQQNNLAGPDAAVLNKPFRKQELAGKVRAALDQ